MRWGNLFSLILAIAGSSHTHASDSNFQSFYDWLKADFKVVSVTHIKHRRHCTLKKVVLEGFDPYAPGLPQKVTLMRFIPDEPLLNIQSELLIYPSMRFPNRGTTPYEKVYSYHLCRQGITSTVIDDWDGYFDPALIDFQSHNQMAIRLWNVSKMTLSYIGKSVYVFGISAGAIYAPMIAGLDDRVLGGVFVVGGAPLGDVLADTKQKALKQQRDHRKEIFDHKSYFQYFSKLKKAVTISPENFVDLNKSKKMLFLIGKNDKTVPYQYQLKLWEYWGKPKKYEFRSGHIMTILGSYFFKHKKVEGFLVDQINNQNPSDSESEPVAKP